MSNYPPGFSGGIEQEDEVPHKCKECGFERVVPMYYELGGWFYPADCEDDAVCPVCEELMDLESD